MWTDVSCWVVVARGADGDVLRRTERRSHLLTRLISIKISTPIRHSPKRGASARSGRKLRWRPSSVDVSTARRARAKRKLLLS